MISGSDLTVVIPTYRRPLLLAQALESIVEQNVPGLRVAVFDNASGDRTPEVVAAIRRRHPIEYVCHAENLGAARNIQASLAAVKTPYCAMLGDDDLHLPGFLATALERLGRHPSAAAFCGRTVVFDDVSRQAYRVQGSGWRAGFYRAGEATRQMVHEHFTFTGAVFKTDAFKALPFSGGDMEFMAALAERYDFVVGEELTAIWRLHQGSWTRLHAVDEERRAAINRLQSYLELRTLEPQDRFEVVLRTMRELAHKTFHFALQGIIAGGRQSELARDLRSAARVLTSLQDEFGWSDRLLVEGAKWVVGRGDREITPTRAKALHVLAAGSARLARWATPRVAVNADDPTTQALAYVEAVTQRVESWYGALSEPAA